MDRERIPVARRQRDSRENGGIAQPNRHVRRGQPRDSAQHAENRAFGDQLPEQAAIRRSDRQSDLDLAPSPHRAREQEIRDVRTGDHQHQANRETHRHDERHELLQADERRRVGEADSRGPRLSFGDARRQVERSGGLRRQHTGPQASVESNGPIRAVVVQLIPWIALQLPAHRQGNPEVRHIRLSADEFPGGDPDDLVGMAVEAHVPADERPVAAEPPAPEALAQDHDRVCPRREIVLRCQEPAERGLTAKHPEVIARNRQPEGELIAWRNDVVVRRRPPGDGVT